MAIIAVIVPVYKVEPYLNRCVDSLLNQTFRDFSLVLVDDGSPDGCGAICDDYARQDARVHVVHQKNAGLSIARNVGIEWALSRDDIKWISFVDSDDWVQPTYLDMLLNAAENNAADLAVGGHIVTQGEALPPVREAAVSLWNPEDYYLQNTINAVVSWGKLYRKNLFKNIRFPAGKIHEDEFVFYQILFQYDWIPVIEQPLYAYYRNPNGISGGKWTYARLDRLEAFEKQIAFFLHNGMWKTARKRFYVFVRNNLYSQEMISKCDSLTMKEKKHYISHCKNRLRHVLIQYRKCGWFHFHSSDWNKYVYSNAFVSIRIAREAWGRVKAVLKRIPAISFTGHQILRIWRRRRDVLILIRYAHGAFFHRAILMQSPLHGNLGDHAIALSEIALLRDYNVSFMDFPWTEKLEKYCAKITPGNRLILHQGGGNLGQLWPNEEMRFRASLKAFCRNKIIVFPQTVFFNMESEEDIRFFQESKEIYEGHPDLTLFVRERYSYEFMRRYMSKVRVELVPDMVMILDVENDSQPRRGVLLCMRNDKEKTITEEAYAYLVSCLHKYFDKVSLTDTVLQEHIDPSEREVVLREKLSKFSRASLVVTDRLHGMVFAAITETPCIVLNSLSHKVVGCHEWLNELDYIKLVKNIEEVPMAIQELQNVKPDYCRGSIEKAMEPLYEAIRNADR